MSALLRCERRTHTIVLCASSAASSTASPRLQPRRSIELTTGVTARGLEPKAYVNLSGKPPEA